MALAAEPEYARQIGDVGEQARLQVIRRIAGQNTAVAEVVAGRLERLRRELAGPAPTPLEALLVDRICMNHLLLHRVEMIAAQNEGQLSIRQADYGQRTIDRAQKRYLSAIKALAEIRRLPLPPSVQINLGAQQVNVA
ncbi:MAG: hypothetical protein AVDCRST_MAG88-1113 [uncultured Thermomicrobiales bacterium]|uniref:Uncharacterized protein n=1 Tax=uncultured Thermomicrobiales bacterium TaxID=1645740 RepID=A0A6J4URP6_9BACT|nr:MAG: hypothetical protein AVDCRST_MAG88-1113 [uncultured Thermomicrobiales bacterium]